MDISVIIELENLRYSELWRTEKMLQQLAKQILENNDRFSSKTEIIMVHDKDETYDFDIEKFAKDNLKQCLSLIDFKLIDAPPNTTYYAAKNYGFKHSSNEIIVFLDPDVIPDDGWLSTILESLSDSNITALGGVAYIDPKTLIEKAFTSFWQFPPKCDMDYHSTDLARLVANNWVIRRKVFSKYNFPSYGSARGACAELNNILTENGFQTLRLTSARVSHPIPNGLHHIFVRGLSEGQSLMLSWKGSHDTHLTQEQQTERKSLSRFLKTKYRIFNERCKLMKLTRTEKIGCFFIGCFYFSIVGTGAIITYFDPKLIKENVRV